MLCGCGQSKADETANLVDITVANTENNMETEEETSSLTETANLNTELSDEYTEADTAKVNLIMVGDMLIHTPINETAAKEDGTVNFDHLFTHTKDMIEKADIALVNQEVILGGKELGISGYPAFNTYYELGDSLADAGFDVVLHATNHALDKGKQGILNCIDYWENNHPEIAVLGIEDTASEQDNIYIYEKNNIKIAILNYTYGTNGIPLPQDMPYAVNLMDKEKIKQDINLAKTMADFIIVCPHWGTEYILEESEYQQNYAEFFLECEVDLVIGTHPHVIEPVELMKNEETGHEMLVYYSLGNFVNCTGSETDDIGIRMLGAMADVTIAKNTDGKVYIEEYTARPLITYVSDNQEIITVYPMDEFDESLAQSSYTIRFDKDFSKEYCEEIWNQVFNNLPEEE